MITSNANQGAFNLEADEKKKLRQASKQFYSFLQGNGFSVHKIRMDGNCLFRSISHQLTDTDEHYAAYRELAVNQLKCNEDIYKDFVDESFDGGFSSYVKRMSKSGVWGGHLELMALSKVLSVKFCIIIDTEETVWVDMNSDQEVQTLHLAYHRRRFHYFSIKRSMQSSQSEISDSSNDETEEKTHKSKKKKVTKKKETLLNKTQETNKRSFELFKQGNHQQMEVEVPISERKIVKVKEKAKKDFPSISSHENNLVKKINFKEIFLLDNKTLILWCVENNILRKPVCCPTCRKRTNKMKEVRLSNSKNYMDKVIWRCKDRSCGGIVSIRKGNKLLETFYKIKLRIILIFIFTHFSVMLPPVASCMTLGIKKETLQKLYKMLSGWVIQEQIKDENMKGKFGGEDIIIEMDESCFLGRKNNKGRLLKQIWAFGFVERNSGRLYAQVVKKRDRETLIPIITRWIRPTCLMVITDEWRPYQILSKLGYHHESIKHKDNFVRKDNKLVHTQTIENRWGLIKGRMKKRGRYSRESFDLQIKEIVWRILNKDLIREKLLEIIAKYNY